MIVGNGDDDCDGDVEDDDADNECRYEEGEIYCFGD
jgi:hypothetical protein